MTMTMTMIKEILISVDEFCSTKHLETIEDYITKLELSSSPSSSSSSSSSLSNSLNEKVYLSSNGKYVCYCEKNNKQTTTDTTTTTSNLKLVCSVSSKDLNKKNDNDITSTTTSTTTSVVVETMEYTLVKQQQQQQQDGVEEGVVVDYYYQPVRTEWCQYFDLLSSQPAYCESFDIISMNNNKSSNSNNKSNNDDNNQEEESNNNKNKIKIQSCNILDKPCGDGSSTICEPCQGEQTISLTAINCSKNTEKNEIISSSSIQQQQQQEQQYPIVDCTMNYMESLLYSYHFDK